MPKARWTFSAETLEKVAGVNDRGCQNRPGFDLLHSRPHRFTIAPQASILRIRRKEGTMETPSIQSTLRKTRSLSIVIPFLLSIPFAHGITFRWAIQGEITAAYRADPTGIHSGTTLPGFGLNSPMFVGDHVTGILSYDGPTRNVWLGMPGLSDVTLTLFFGPNPAICFFTDYSPDTLYVAGETIEFGGSRDGGGLHSTILSTWFNLVELGPYHWSQVMGDLSCAPIPDEASTCLLSLAALVLVVTLKWKTTNRKVGSKMSQGPTQTTTR